MKAPIKNIAYWRREIASHEATIRSMYDNPDSAKYENAFFLAGIRQLRGWIFDAEMEIARLRQMAIAAGADAETDGIDDAETDGIGDAGADAQTFIGPIRPLQIIERDLVALADAYQVLLRCPKASRFAGSLIAGMDEVGLEMDAALKAGRG